MKYFCHITEWKTEVCIRGKGKGNTINSRTVIGLDHWNWLTGTQRGDENGNISSESFHGNMNLLLPHLFRTFENHAEIVNRIITRLQELTGKTLTPVIITGEEDYKKLGKSLDDLFGTSYMREYPPLVLKRLFKDESVEAEVA